MEIERNTRYSWLFLGNNYYRNKEYHKALYCYGEWIKRYKQLDSSIQYNIKSCVRFTLKRYGGLKVRVNDVFDHVYVINLKDSSNRRIWINKQFNRENIAFSFTFLRTVCSCRRSFY